MMLLAKSTYKKYNHFLSLTIFIFLTLWFAYLKKNYSFSTYYVFLS